MTQQIVILGAIILFILLLLALRYKMFEQGFMVLGTIIAGVGLLILLALLFSLPVMWLWDYTMPYLFKVPELTVGRAFCLVLLCKILFGNSSTSKKE